MKKKSSLATTLQSIHSQIISDPQNAPKCFVGFDGFTDEIIEAVDQRQTTTSYTPMRKMSDFAQRILDFSGKSCNLELVVRETKIGGNAPILTNALLEGGHRITFCGAIGTEQEIEPVFQKMASRCERVIPLSPSGHSDAIEFHDGKIILGKHANLIDINEKAIFQHIEKRELIEIFDEAALFVCGNWTMLPSMTDIWEMIDREITPQLKKRTSQKPLWMFVDLADPEKRTDDDLKRGLQALTNLAKSIHVILGMNEAEAGRIGRVYGINIEPGGIGQTADFASSIQKSSGLQQILIHATKYAVGASSQEIAKVEGPYTPTPALSTGAGDNFNAGYCNALLYGLDLEQSLLSGVATSGYYVRKGHSPSISELASFLNHWEKSFT